METKLLRIAELAKSDQRMKFTSLAHLLNRQSLVQCHLELPNKKATGINGTTKEQYSETLEENIVDLVSRLKRKKLSSCSGKENVYSEAKFQQEKTFGYTGT
jgi:RNA-directed DNA polymerase